MIEKHPFHLLYVTKAYVCSAVPNRTKEFNLTSREKLRQSMQKFKNKYCLSENCCGWPFWKRNKCSHLLWSSGVSQCSLAKNFQFCLKNNINVFVIESCEFRQVIWSLKNLSEKMYWKCNCFPTNLQNDLIYSFLA